jgi:hypothetical protein
VPWALDGNNLAGGSSRDPVRRAALDLARGQRVRIVLFFDGQPPSGGRAVERLGAVEVRYVVNADAAIVALLAGGGRGWRVATDDRGLAARVRASGAEAVGGAAFWAKGERAEKSGAGDTGDRSAARRGRIDLDGEIERLPAAPGRVRRGRAARRNPR